MAKTTGFFVLINDSEVDKDLLLKNAEAGLINLKSLKAFNTATRKQYKSIIEKEKKKSVKGTEDEKRKRKEYYQRPGVKEKRDEYNKKPEVKERKKKLQAKRNKLLKELREKEPELYAKYYLAKLEEDDDKKNESDGDEKQNVNNDVNKSQ